MKLNSYIPNVETSNAFEEIQFSIGDQAIILDIIRSKLYSNPILAICREISSNARDSLRAVGKFDEPIQIHLPNILEPYFKVKDFGEGISPDRAENVFVKYGVSTKREDNIQTGGFGIGFKSIFSITDSASIITNFNGIQYNYSCFIDETKVGKLILLSESPTKNINGTEIIIPVKPKNFTDFSTWTEQACRHWEVKPIIRGGSIIWQENKKILEGKNWAITSSNDWQRHARMIIDGIEYPLELDSLRKYADSKLIDAAKGHFIMYFGVGELSLSASRENIYLDERTQNVIRDRMNDIYKEIRKSVVDKIEAFSNLWEANIYYRKELRSAFNDLRFLGSLAWKTFPLTESYIQTTCPVFQLSKGRYSRKHGTDPNKLTRSINYHLTFEDTSALYVNDLPLKEPTPRHVKKAFEDNPTLTSIQVVCPTDKVTLASLNKSINLDQMAPKLLSSITKASARSYTPAAARLIIFKFDQKASAFRQVSYASVEEDSKKKVLCTLHKDAYQHTRQVYLKNNKSLALSSIKVLTERFPTYSFYGFGEDAPQTRIDEDFGDFEDIEEFIKENILDNKKIDFVQIKFAITSNYRIDDRGARYCSKLLPLIKNKKSPYLKRVDLHDRIKAINTRDLELLSIYESVNGKIEDKEIKNFLKSNPDFDVDAANSEYEKTYPLLSHISTYSFDNIIEHVAQYINLVDGN